MKSKDKEKNKMSTSKTDHLTANESTSCKEVGVQDRTCTTVLTASTSDTTPQEVSTTVLDELGLAVDTVAGKLTHMENRLYKAGIRCDWDKRTRKRLITGPSRFRQTLLHECDAGRS